MLQHPPTAYLRIQEPAIFKAPVLETDEGDPPTTPPTRPLFVDRYVLRGEICVIGRRAAECDLVIHERLDDISRKHASIQQVDDNQYILIDHHSRNGTFVNGVRLDSSDGAEAQVVLRSGDYISLGMREKIFQFINPADPTISELTNAEREILRFIAKNPALTNKEVAMRFFRSENTIKTHLKRMYKKLGIETRQAAIEYARNCGLAD